MQRPCLLTLCRCMESWGCCINSKPFISSNLTDKWTTIKLRRYDLQPFANMARWHFVVNSSWQPSSFNHFKIVFFEHKGNFVGVLIPNSKPYVPKPKLSCIPDFQLLVYCRPAKKLHRVCRIYFRKCWKCWWGMHFRPSSNSVDYVKYKRVLIP